MPKRIITVEAINDRLKGTGVAVERRGNRLSLRATLPVRGGVGKKQQRISLDVSATPFGLEHAEAKAWELAAQLSQKRFKWKDWDQKLEKNSQFKTNYWIKKHKDLCQSKGFHQDEANWKKTCWAVFKRLPQDESLTAEAILVLANRAPANSRTRYHECTKLQQLADLAGLELDLSPYKGTPNKPQTRNLPSDMAIVQIRNSFTHRRKRAAQEAAYRWQWVYGVMAAYGLRDHEVFFCDIDSTFPYACHISEGKTGPRRDVPPLYVEWAEEWRLWDKMCPEFELTTHIELGQKVSNALGRYIRYCPLDLFHQPYDLRHAYSIRGSTVFGLSYEEMSMHMGHTVEIHIKTYKKYLDRHLAKQSYLDKISRSDRPKPPTP